MMIKQLQEISKLFAVHRAARQQIQTGLENVENLLLAQESTDQELSVQLQHLNQVLTAMIVKCGGEIVLDMAAIQNVPQDLVLQSTLSADRTKVHITARPQEEEPMTDGEVMAQAVFPRAVVVPEGGEPGGACVACKKELQPQEVLQLRVETGLLNPLCVKCYSRRKKAEPEESDDEFAGGEDHCRRCSCRISQAEKFHEVEFNGKILSVFCDSCYQKSLQTPMTNQCAICLEVSGALVLIQPPDDEAVEAVCRPCYDAHLKGQDVVPLDPAKTCVKCESLLGARERYVLQCDGEVIQPVCRVCYKKHVSRDQTVERALVLGVPPGELSLGPCVSCGSRFALGDYYYSIPKANGSGCDSPICPICFARGGRKNVEPRETADM